MTMTPLLKTLIPFQEDYVPPEIVDREVERVILRNFLEPITLGEPQLYNMLVTGTIGVGKTVLTKFIMRELPAMSYYVKMTEADNTFTRVLLRIISILGLPLSPFNLPSNLILMRLIQHFEESKTPILLVFDDFDKVPLKAIRCILHEIPRGTSYCNLLIISRVPAVLEDLPEDTKSTLRCRELPLKPYGKQELYDIVKQRANLALNMGEQAVEDEVLWAVAETASLSGSAREAIELLKAACLNAAYLSRVKVTIEDFECAVEELERKSLEETIRELPTYHKLILQCCAPHPKTYEQVYNEWRFKLRESNLRELSIYRFRDFVAELKKLDLIRSELRGHGRGRGFSYFLQLSPHAAEAMRRAKPTVGA